MPGMGLFPRVLRRCEGGLVTVIDTSPYSALPCARVLSVAGLLVVWCLFPLGRAVIPEVFLLRPYPWFLTFRELSTEILS